MNPTVKEIIKYFLDLIKTHSGLRIDIFVLVMTGILLFTPVSLIDRLGLGQLRVKSQPLLGLIFLGAAVILLIDVVDKSIQWVKKRLQYTGKDAKKRLDSLSVIGKGIVCRMYNSESHSLRLPVDSATAELMYGLSIISRPSTSGQGILFDWFLQPWVVAYLDRHPEYLAGFPDITDAEIYGEYNFLNY